MQGYEFSAEQLAKMIARARGQRFGGRADQPRQVTERPIYQTSPSEMWRPGTGVQPYQPVGEVSVLDQAPMDEDEFDWYDGLAGAGEEMLSNMDRQSDDLWYGRQENRGDELMRSLSAPGPMARHAARKQRRPQYSVQVGEPQIHSPRYSVEVGEPRIEGPQIDGLEFALRR